MPLIYNKWGLANRIGDTIILNENLQSEENRWLHDILLKHEMLHNDNLKFNLEHDFNSLQESSGKEFVEKVLFCMKHPRALVQLSPIWFYNKRLYFDLSLFIVYVVMIVLLWANHHYFGDVVIDLRPKVEYDLPTVYNMSKGLT